MKKILTTAVAAVISLASLTAASYAANAYGENTPDSIEIIVDYGEYEDELPVGKVGKSYPVFAGVVTDESGNVTGEPDVRVYSPDGTLLPIKNGRFATAVAGKYRIEYYASAGALSAEETVEVTVDDTAAPLVYTLDENFPDSAYCGENVFLTDGTRTGPDLRQPQAVRTDRRLPPGLRQLLPALHAGHGCGVPRQHAGTVSPLFRFLPAERRL